MAAFHHALRSWGKWQPVSWALPLTFCLPWGRRGVAPPARSFLLRPTVRRMLSKPEVSLEVERMLSSSEEFDEVCWQQNWPVLQELPDVLTSSRLNQFLRPRPQSGSDETWQKGPFQADCLNEPTPAELEAYQSHLARWFQHTCEIWREWAPLSLVNILQSSKFQMKWAATALPFFHAVSSSRLSTDELYLASDYGGWAIMFDDAFTGLLQQPEFFSQQPQPPHVGRYQPLVDIITHARACYRQGLGGGDTPVSMPAFEPSMGEDALILLRQYWVMASMTTYLGQEARRVIEKRQQVPVLDLSPWDQQRLQEGLESALHGMQLSMQRQHSAPTNCEEFLQRHIDWEENLSFIRICFELQDVPDEWGAIRGEGPPLDSSTTTLDSSNIDTRLPQRMQAYQDRMGLSYATSQCITLSNDLMAAKDMIEGESDESYLALLMHEMLSRDQSPHQLRCELESHLAPDVGEPLDRFEELPNLNAIDDETLMNWMRECRTLDMSDVVQHGSLLRKFLPTPIGFVAMHALNRQLRRAFSDLIQEAQDYTARQLHLEGSEPVLNAMVRAHVASRLRWALGHHIMTATVPRYGPSFVAYKACCLDKNYPQFLHLLAKLTAKN